MSSIDPAAAATQGGAALRHIADAARSAGADFDFLVRTAARESNFDADAKARTSSAAGLFQFIEQTWLAMMKRHGGEHGFASEAAEITQRADGRFEVADPAARAAILDLRFDPAAASKMAAELAGENAGVLREALGREPSSGELYAAHFLGARSAAELIETVRRDPGARADALFPAAAAANRPIFYEGGRARSASEVLSVLAETHDGANGAEPARPAAAPAAFASAPSSPGVPRQDAPGLILSPALVEILASLEAPAPARRRG